MTDEKDEEINELKERLARLEGAAAQPAAPAPPVPPKAHPKAGCGGWIAAGLTLVAVLYMVGQCSSGSDGTGPGAPETAWIPPEGYFIEPNTRGGAIATEWETPTRAECRGSGVTCFAVNVVTERDCPRSLYASITLLDASGGNIGWTNDTAQGVQAGERTRLVFDTYERGVKSARIAEINCY